MCELNGDSGEDKLEVPPVLEVSRAEGGPEASVGKHPLRDRLLDGALPRSSQPIQPVDGGTISVTRPKFDFVQNSAAGSFETTSSVTMSILGLSSVVEIVEDGCIGCGVIIE